MAHAQQFVPPPNKYLAVDVKTGSRSNPLYVEKDILLLSIKSKTIFGKQTN